MAKYDPPPNEEMLLGHFSTTKRIKKKLREWLFFESTQQVFVNSELLGTSGFLCALHDGISQLRYDNKSSPFFIDSQWIIDEKIGDGIWKEVERLVKELRSTYERGGFLDKKDNE